MQTNIPAAEKLAGNPVDSSLSSHSAWPYSTRYTAAFPTIYPHLKTTLPNDNTNNIKGH
ncbi:hypothetical protein D934_06060 [Xylella fastidiosa subsp. sandyi Ann-1]|uniref:Uncharacterized protein n=1 Tax=Xylella fastidiosa subsp. sandyi Ann-1 TaxID=155920 RepID=A0A060H338_XYLFS|nr:hypothetical protein D934_06060 [Xylella fastidiosa subsp. sandyi Ann-1]